MYYYDGLMGFVIVYAFDVAFLNPSNGTQNPDSSASYTPVQSGRGQ